MEKKILRIEHLQKMYRSHWTFRPIQAVRDVSLEVPYGEAFGFLGSNGAGKTTTLKCITGLIRKTAGKIYVDGIDIDVSNKHQGVSYLPEQPYFYDHLSIAETLDFLATLYGIPSSQRKQKIPATLELVGLADRKKNTVRSLSKGLQQRLNLAQAIINQPKLLILDEPFSGMDPVGRSEFRNILLDLKKHGTTLFMSSHVLSDVEDICDRVSIMKKGELKSIFRLDTIPETFGEKFRLLIDPNEQGQTVVAKLQAIADSSSIETHIGKSAQAFIFADYTVAQQALTLATDAHCTVYEFRGVRPRLEEIFISLTQEATAGT